MEILFLFPEIKKNSLAFDYLNKYIRNSTKFIKIKPLTFRTEATKNKIHKQKFEAKEILKLIKPEDRVCLFDEKGKHYSSRALSEKIFDTTKRTVFIVGGPYGFDEEIYKRADLKISLSNLTLNSELATAVVAEQIFRITSLHFGHPYHND